MRKLLAAADEMIGFLKLHGKHAPVTVVEEHFVKAIHMVWFGVHLGLCKQVYAY